MKRAAGLFSAMLLSAGLIFVASHAQAATKKRRAAPKTMTVKGDVTAKFGKKGKLLGVTLKAEDGKVYRVFLNKAGIKLGRKLNGKKAEVVARLVRRGTKKKPVLWLRVVKFSPVKEAAPPAEEEAGGEDTGSEQP